MLREGGTQSVRGDEPPSITGPRRGRVAATTSLIEIVHNKRLRPERLGMLMSSHHTAFPFRRKERRKIVPGRVERSHTHTHTRVCACASRRKSEIKLAVERLEKLVHHDINR